MKNILLPLVVLLIFSCSHKETPAPPVPYTNEEIASLYWQSYIKSCLAQPDSFEVVSEEFDSVRLYCMNEDYDDSIMTYHVEATFTFKNIFGGWSKQTEEFIAIPHLLVSKDGKEWYYCKNRGSIYLTRYMYAKESKTLMVTEDMINKRTAIWNAYNDSIDNVRKN